MGYAELKGTDRDVAQSILKAILDHDDTVTMLVFGLDQSEIAGYAKEVADQEPNTWWTVWIQNLNLLTEEQQKKYCKKQSVICTLSTSDEPVVWLGEKDAKYKNKLLKAFLQAQQGREDK